ncbi:chaperone modulator CbpM [Hyphomicrobium sp.]|jgi:chaperone modulatory protein CbpM|uniref:chaperone modulator CbpM n=1 Tax=Hyphomicrobium sp. TaxID=82 RepID=UPI0035686238
MTDTTIGAIPAEPIGTDPVYSLEELSIVCNVETAWVVELVEQGIIEARGTTVSEWRFSSVSIVRLAKAKRFDRDLGLNPAGIALVFDLLGEIDRLKARLNVLKGARTSLADRSSDDRDQV